MLRRVEVEVEVELEVEMEVELELLAGAGAGTDAGAAEVSWVACQTFGSTFLFYDFDFLIGS